MHVDVKLVKKTRLLSLRRDARRRPSWPTMRVLRRGNRLSITPVSDDEWREVVSLLGGLSAPSRFDAVVIGAGAAGLFCAGDRRPARRCGCC